MGNRATPRSEHALTKEFLNFLSCVTRKILPTLKPPVADNDPTIKEQLQLIDLKVKLTTVQERAAKDGLEILRGKARGAKGDSAEVAEEVERLAQMGEGRIDDEVAAIKARLEGHKDAITKEALRKSPEATAGEAEEA